MTLLMLLTPFALAGSPLIGVEAQVGPAAGATRDLGIGTVVGWRFTRSWTLEVSGHHLRTLAVPSRDQLLEGTETAVEHATTSRLALLPVFTLASGSLGWADSSLHPLDLSIDVGAGPSVHWVSSTVRFLGQASDRRTTHLGPSWLLGPRLTRGRLELRLRASGNHWTDAIQTDPDVPTAQRRVISRLHTGLSVAILL